MHAKTPAISIALYLLSQRSLCGMIPCDENLHFGLLEETDAIGK
jgi:hypothetical protein